MDNGETAETERNAIRSEIEKNVISPQFSRTLGQNQAIALLSFASVSANNVLECTSVFVEKTICDEVYSKLFPQSLFW